MMGARYTRYSVAVGWAWAGGASAMRAAIANSILVFMGIRHI